MATTTDIYPLIAQSLTKNMRLAYEETPAQWTKVVHGNTTNRRVEDTVTWIGRGLPYRRDPKEPIVYSGVAPNFTKRFVMVGYTQADCLAEEDILDDAAGVLLRWAAARGGEFAVAWRTLEETLVFSYLGVIAFSSAEGSPDGVPYASDAHPMSAQDTRTLWSNLINADLSPTSFRLAQNMLETQLAPNGVTYLNNFGRTLIVNPYNREMAIRLTQGEWEPNTADRNMNIWTGKTRVVVSPYFKRAGVLGAAASPPIYNGWVLQGDTHYFEWYWRERPVFREWAEETIRARAYASHIRCALGHEDPRGMIFGSGT